MRKQYFFRPSQHDLAAWDVDRLIALTGGFPRRRVSLARIRELGEPWPGPGEVPSWTALVAQGRPMEAADLAHPIILEADGRVMDGMHRVAKKLWLGHTGIATVRFPSDPPPAYLDVQPADPPY